MAVKAIASKKLMAMLDELGELPNPTQLEKKRVLRSIEPLKTVDVVSYYSFMGVYYSILGDYESCRAEHLKALKLSSKPELFLNYAVSIRRLGRYSESLSILISGGRSNFTAVDYISEICETVYITGDFGGFDSALEVFSRANPEVQLQDVWAIKKVLELRRVLKLAGVPEREYCHAMTIVNQVLISNGFSNRFTMVSSGGLDGVPHISTRFAVPVTQSKLLSQINDQFADAIISDDELSSWDRLIFTAVSSAGNPSGGCAVA